LNGIRPGQSLGNVNQTATARTETSKTGFHVPAAAGIPPTPPPEVLQALDTVQKVAGELRARGLDVRFDRTGDRDVTAKVVDAKGNVVRDIPVVEALDVLSGEKPLKV
jgi:hypothetical protein